MKTTVKCSRESSFFPRDWLPGPEFDRSMPQNSFKRNQRQRYLEDIASPWMNKQSPYILFKKKVLDYQTLFSLITAIQLSNKRNTNNDNLLFVCLQFLLDKRWYTHQNVCSIYYYSTSTRRAIVHSRRQVSLSKYTNTKTRRFSSIFDETTYSYHTCVSFLTYAILRIYSLIWDMALFL